MEMLAAHAQPPEMEVGDANLNFLDNHEDDFRNCRDSSCKEFSKDDGNIDEEEEPTTIEDMIWSAKMT